MFSSFSPFFSAGKAAAAATRANNANNVNFMVVVFKFSWVFFFVISVAIFPAEKFGHHLRKRKGKPPMPMLASSSFHPLTQIGIGR